jgi:putative addiction module component (TIGR02574 family)
MQEVVGSGNIQAIIQLALDLAPDDRIAIAQELLASVESEDDCAVAQAWKIEVDRRRSALENGSVMPISWGDVQNRIQARLQS